LNQHGLTYAFWWIQLRLIQRKINWKLTDKRWLIQLWLIGRLNQLRLNQLGYQLVWLIQLWLNQHGLTCASSKSFRLIQLRLIGRLNQP